MPAFKPCTAANVKEVLSNLSAYSDKHSSNAEIIAEELNVMLDNLLNDDFFGTEGQCDPRGDHRD